MDVAYFAYGSNMWSEQMLGRCPTAVSPVLACLPGWRMLINERGVATIIRDAAGEVHGVLWRLGDVDLAALDVAEGVGEGRYDRLSVVVVDGHGASIVAEVYVDPRCTPGPARAGYRERVLDGATEHGLPAAYRTFLRDV